MSSFHDYRLSSGIYYSLLLDCISSSDYYKANRRTITQPAILCDLFRVFNPSFEYLDGEKNSKKPRNSDYKSCKSDDREYFLYNNNEAQSVTKETILSDLNRHLSRFDGFLIKYHVPEEPAILLTRRLLDLLSLDDTIPNDELFYVQEDGTALTKGDLLTCNTIQCNSFLFAIWFYVCFREEENQIGEETYLHFWKPRTEKHSIRIPPLGSKFAQTTIIFQLRNKKVFDLDQIEEDIQSNPVYSDLLNELKNDFMDLFEFILTNNPYKTSVYDYGEIDTIRDLIRKWGTKLLLMDNSFFSQTTQLLMHYLAMYVSFFDNIYIENRIIGNQIQKYSPKFNDETYRDELREVFLPESEAVIRSLKMIFSLIYDPRDVK